MSARRWRVAPDQAIEIDGELVGVVSRQAITEAIMDGEALLARTGGILTVAVGRRRTDFPGEAITTEAVVEWKPAARVADKPEQEVALGITQPVPVPAPPPEPAETPAADAEQEGLVEAAAAHADEIGDGLDPGTLEEEDVSSLKGAV